SSKNGNAEASAYLRQGTHSRVRTDLLFGVLLRNYTRGNYESRFRLRVQDSGFLSAAAAVPSFDAQLCHTTLSLANTEPASAMPTGTQDLLLTCAYAAFANVP